MSEKIAEDVTDAFVIISEITMFASIVMYLYLWLFTRPKEIITVTKTMVKQNPLPLETGLQMSVVPMKITLTPSSTYAILATVSRFIYALRVFLTHVAVIHPQPVSRRSVTQTLVGSLSTSSSISSLRTPSITHPSFTPGSPVTSKPMPTFISQFEITRIQVSGMDAVKPSVTYTFIPNQPVQYPKPAGQTIGSFTLSVGVRKSP